VYWTFKWCEAEEKIVFGPETLDWNPNMLKTKFIVIDMDAVSQIAIVDSVDFWSFILNELSGLACFYLYT
jgi:hypothetical protein